LFSTLTGVGTGNPRSFILFKFLNSFSAHNLINFLGFVRQCP
jgi:hypothetical protein